MDLFLLHEAHLQEDGSKEGGVEEQGLSALLSLPLSLHTHTSTLTQGPNIIQPADQQGLRKEAREEEGKGGGLLFSCFKVLVVCLSRLSFIFWPL